MVMTDLERSNAELRAAVILAGKRIVKLNFGRRNDPVVPILQRALILAAAFRIAAAYSSVTPSCLGTQNKSAGALRLLPLPFRAALAWRSVRRRGVPTDFTVPSFPEK